MSNLPPGSIILLGALVVAFLRGRLRQLWTVGIPIVSFAHLVLAYSTDTLITSHIFGHELTPIRVDRLSLVWGYVFHVAAILASIYAWRVRDRMQDFSAMVYVGASIGAVFAGDLLTLFVYWEITAVSSVFLIWANHSNKSKVDASWRQTLASGMRYITLHVASGVLVLAGALLLFVERGSLSFGSINQVGVFHELSGWGEILLLIGFGIKGAFPLLHCWLPDAYPKATVTGTVFLSAFTTKMAIYALARGFAGCDILLTVGAVMALFPLVHALLADDMRQTLAHILNNQLGFMVAGIGVGSELAINGVAAQAFAHVIYKGLLFMSIGAVLQQVGTAKQSQLGGLSKPMPWTCAFCLIGAWSVFPLNCGFVTKALVLGSVAESHHPWIWLALVCGAVGAFLIAGLKVPYFTFFAKPYCDRGQIEEAPTHMLVAMGLSAAICLAIGFVPSAIYSKLPYACDYHPYSLSHVVQQLQLLAFTTLAFALAIRFNLYPAVVQGTLLDVDWLYRKPLPAAARLAATKIEGYDPLAMMITSLARHGKWMSAQCSEAGLLGRSVSTNAMAISAAVLLAVYLLMYY